MLISKGYIGVDPGIEGAIAIIFEKYIRIYPIQFDGNILKVDWMLQRMDSIVYIEKVWKPINLVRLAGIIEGTFLSRGDIVERVAPSTWRKFVLGNGHATKQDAIDYCKEKYPDVSLFKTERSRIENHNFAEALCIAEYARRHS